uniref:LITAF domain-containing protein n=1 Tax=Stomoxys calcitrans TaxID=35570 RepID=A0A1I8NNQ6_STOCA
MVLIDESSLKVTLPQQPILKPIDLKSIGFLQKIPTSIECPACQTEGMSIVRLESVTCWQKFLKATNWCKTAESRYDINHYCSDCGCYLGRYVAIGCGERCLSQQARKKAAADAMTLRKEPKNWAKNVQQSREKVLANMAKERTERKQKKLEKEIAAKSDEK